MDSANMKPRKPRIGEVFVGLKGFCCQEEEIQANVSIGAGHEVVDVDSL
jgi:hypothetical protein